MAKLKVGLVGVGMPPSARAGGGVGAECVVLLLVVVVLLLDPPVEVPEEPEVVVG
jgi:hypothetical protein